MKSKVSVQVVVHKEFRELSSRIDQQTRSLAMGQIDPAIYVYNVLVHLRDMELAMRRVELELMIEEAQEENS